MDKRFIVSRIYLALVASSVALMVSGCALPGRRMLPVMAVLEPTDVHSAGFWIARHPFADNEVLDAEEIHTFNRTVTGNLGITPVAEFSEYFSRKKLYQSLENSYKTYSQGGGVFENGLKISGEFWIEVKKNVRWDMMYPDTQYRFGLVSQRTSLRMAPTNKRVFQKKSVLPRDILHLQTLEIGTPVAIVHESYDGNWAYVEIPEAEGWVERTALAICSRADVQNYSKTTPFVVITDAQVDVFSDSTRQQFVGQLVMGSRFPLEHMRDKDLCALQVPTRDPVTGTVVFTTAYVRRCAVNEGYVPYTPRAVIDLAFRMQSAPVMCGRNGTQDEGFLSYLRCIFATFGIYLPATLEGLKQTGVALEAVQDKMLPAERLEAVTKYAIGAITVLMNKSQAVLYLGMANDQPYGIYLLTDYYVQQKKYANRVPVYRTAVKQLTALDEQGKPWYYSLASGQVLLTADTP